jgi:hypothetical protein
MILLRNLRAMSRGEVEGWGVEQYCSELAWFVYSGPNSTGRENIHKSQLGGMNDNKLYK